MSTGYRLVETGDALLEICEQLKRSDWLAVDTEFEREKTYYPELCLVQIASADTVAVIDPIAIKDLGALFGLLYDTSITKVFHAARQDLEIFFHLQGTVPQPLFDTQIAAPLLGYDEQLGYANLVSKVLGVSLSKAHTRTDWKRRPLHKEQLQYAADDVIYLAQIYDILLIRLKDLGRMEWLADDFAALGEPDLYQPDPESVWRKIRGAKNLKGKKLSALQHLAAWRERTARAENMPRNWILRDEAMIDLARLLPGTTADLQRIKALNDGLIRRHGAELIRLIGVSGQQEAPVLAHAQTRKPLNIQEEAKVDALSVMVRMLANANDLHPNILAPRKELEKFVQDQNSSLLLKGWREHLVGRQLKVFLDGGISFQIEDRELTWKKV